MIRVRRLRTRVILFSGALLAVVALTGLLLVNSASARFATAKTESELNVGERIFARLLEQKAQELSQSARVLAADFAFREAVATGDSPTIESTLENHGERIGASAMMYVRLDHEVLADTLHPHGAARKFEYARLLERADSDGAAADIAVVSGRGLQLVAVPLRAPLRIGWVVLGFAVDGEFARDLARLTGLDVSIFSAQTGNDQPIWRLLASTVSQSEASQLAAQINDLSKTDLPVLNSAGAAQQVRVVRLTRMDDRLVIAVLHRSLADALSGFDTLRKTLLALTLAALLVAIFGSIAISLNITRPLSDLAAAAARMETGDYSTRVIVNRHDEIATLASSLNHMQVCIAEREQQVLVLAYQDPLTGLANRARFSQQLAAALDRARADATEVAVIMMDLDRFKYVNDSLGHSVGDHVLGEVARRLLQTCPFAQCVSRLGGDEFAVLLTGTAAENVSLTARTITQTLEQPVVFDNQPLDVGASLGIAQYPQHGTDAQTIVRNADIAMYVAKRNKSGTVMYDPDYDSTQRAHLFMLGELRRAVERNELRLVYQPKASLSSANINSVEALIRWAHPERGQISPADFIPFAEHTGYIKVITRWVLNEAMRQCGEWLRRGIRLQVAVNISAKDLMNRELPEQVGALLQAHGVPPALLCLEITESGFMEDPAHAQKVLDCLAAMGLKLAIDDYGTGYSSLSYIMRLPVQELKIDRSFVSGMVGNEDLFTIVRSTIDLGHNLGMKVVAEGVENRSGWDLLRTLGCDDAQGYFLSKPLEADALVRWLREESAHQPLLSDEHNLRQQSA